MLKLVADVFLRVQVSSELDKRLDRLEELRTDLGGFQDHLDDLDAWLGDASNDLANIRLNMATCDTSPDFLQSVNVCMPHKYTVLVMY